MQHCVQYMPCVTPCCCAHYVSTLPSNIIKPSLVSKVFFQKRSGCFGRCRTGLVNARVFRVSISYDQPVAPHEVNCMIDVDATPWLLEHHPWMVGRLSWSVLVFSTCSATSACIFNLTVDGRPVDC